MPYWIIGRLQDFPEPWYALIAIGTVWALWYSYHDLRKRRRLYLAAREVHQERKQCD